MRGLEFEVTIEQGAKLFVEQNARCTLSGRDIHLAANKQTASLDRKDSSRGYIFDNIQWVHKDVNLAKMTLSDTDFIQLCREIVMWNSKRLSDA